jgi:hypothetical protein
MVERVISRPEFSGRMAAQSSRETVKQFDDPFDDEGVAPEPHSLCLAMDRAEAGLVLRSRYRIAPEEHSSASRPNRPRSLYGI